MTQKRENAVPWSIFVTVVYSKQVHYFFQTAEKVKSYLHGIALPNFSIIHYLLQNKLRNDTPHTFVYQFFDVGSTTRCPRYGVGTKLR